MEKRLIFMQTLRAWYRKVQDNQGVFGQCFATAVNVL